jgi:hypothetical protein
MRRASVGLICGVVLMGLSACDSTDHKPVARTAAQPVGSLCERVQPTLTGSWKAEDAESTRGLIPLSDSCWLTDSADANNRFRISVSVLPITAEDAAEIRKSETFYANQVIVDGGVGSDSWAVNPSDSGPWLVFRSGERMVKVAKITSDKGQLDAVRAVAKTIDTLPGGIPAAPATVQRPECARGTAAAEELLGTSATARRDTIVNGLVRCLWGSARGTVFAEAGGMGSAPGTDFSSAKHDAPTQVAPQIVPVKVGAEGWQHADGISYRVGKDTYVTVGAVPQSSMQPAATLALAKAMLPAYGG